MFCFQNNKTEYMEHSNIWVRVWELEWKNKGKEWWKPQNPPQIRYEILKEKWLPSARRGLLSTLIQSFVWSSHFCFAGLCCWELDIRWTDYILGELCTLSLHTEEFIERNMEVFKVFFKLCEGANLLWLNSSIYPQVRRNWIRGMSNLGHIRDGFLCMYKKLMTLL